MNLHNMMKNIGLKSTKEGKLIYKLNDYDVTISFIEYEKKHKEEVIALYYLIDVSKLESQAIEIVENYDSFKLFQESFMSKTFFNFENWLKYNIYLILVFSDSDLDNFDKNIKKEIELNLEFSRKVFLKYSEIEKYFNYYDILDKFKPSNKYEKSKFDTIKNCVSKLDSYGLKSVLITQVSSDTNDDLFRCIFKDPSNKKLDYDYIKNNNITPEKFYEKYFSNKYNTLVKQNTRNEFKHIDKISNESFRKQILKNNVTVFKKFNLLCGENASGKTSLLELIEYTMTGKTQRDNNAKHEGIATIYSTNGNEFSSQLSFKRRIELKSAWYNNKIGSLNKLFRRINYFDIDAAYNFAIEYEKSKYQDFFCDYQLYFMKENINNHINAFINIQKAIKSILSHLDTLQKREGWINEKVDLVERIKKKIQKLRNRNICFNTNPSIVDKYLKISSNIDKYIEILNACLNKVDDIIEEETRMYLTNINIIYWVLFSNEQIVDYNNIDKGLTINKKNSNEMPFALEEISTAQRVCVALSVIFAQFFSASNAPKFILLDETVANFDSIHLLNLLDFLRELVINDVQIVFATADKNIRSLTEKKFGFLKDEFKIIMINNLSDEE